MEQFLRKSESNSVCKGSKLPGIFALRIGLWYIYIPPSANERAPDWFISLLSEVTYRPPSNSVIYINSRARLVPKNVLSRIISAKYNFFLIKCFEKYIKTRNFICWKKYFWSRISKHQSGQPQSGWNRRKIILKKETRTNF